MHIYTFIINNKILYSNSSENNEMTEFPGNMHIYTWCPNSLESYGNFVQQFTRLHFKKKTGLTDLVTDWLMGQNINYSSCNKLCEV